MDDIQYSFRNIVISILFAGTIGGILMFIPQLLWGRVIIYSMLEKSGYNPVSHVPDVIPLFIGCLLFSYLMMMLLSIYALMIFDILVSFKVGFVMGITCFYIFCVATNARIAITLPNTLSPYLEHAFLFWWLGSTIMSTVGVYLLFKSDYWVIKFCGIILMILPVIVGGTSQGTDLENISHSHILHYYLILWIPIFIFWIISGSMWGMMLKHLRLHSMTRYQH